MRLSCLIAILTVCLLLGTACEKEEPLFERTYVRHGETERRVTVSVFGKLEENGWICDHIAVRTRGGNYALAVMYFDFEPMLSHKEDFGFEWEDMNFDGFPDFRMIANEGNANIYYKCWLWDNREQEFAEEPQLSELSSPEFLSDKQLIFSHNRSSAIDMAEEYYRWRDNALEKVSSFSQERMNANTLLVTVGSQKDGQMIYTEKQVAYEPEIENLPEEVQKLHEQFRAIEK